MAEYAMVSVLVIVLFLAAFQLGFALHVRNTLIAHAAEGLATAPAPTARPRPGPTAPAP
ncbi:TadE/TadG family type IV pilus assembly protein [Barrientosiimonas endolithica]|uniref:TadE-like domain-containing protein n=1 Tax=Barrientosiimonas endolithica TaxID=1535208 RepID=A0ABM8HCW8_9MICO|nr:hypothetical protein GCM10025872_24730 [Barrientosiimonas endolithica]